MRECTITTPTGKLVTDLPTAKVIARAVGISPELMAYGTDLDRRCGRYLVELPPRLEQKHYECKGTLVLQTQVGSTLTVDTN